MLGFRIPQGIFHPGLRHFMAAKSCEQRGQLRSGLNLLPDQHGGDVIADDVPCGIGRFRVEQGTFHAGDFAPAADAIDRHLDQQNSALLGDSEAGLKRCFQTHAKLSQRNLLDFHKAPEGKWRVRRSFQML